MRNYRIGVANLFLVLLAMSVISCNDTPNGPVLEATGKIVYVYSATDESADDEIWIMNTDGSGKTRLTTNSVVDHQPDVTKDGSKIVFKRDGQTFLMNSDGSNQEMVPGGGMHPALSPDGGRIAYGTEGQIWLMNVDGSNPTLLVDGQGLCMPCWSPDGSQIAYSVGLYGDQGVYTVNIDGSGVKRIFSHQAYKTAWSPDGTEIAFDSDYNTDELDLHVIKISDGSVRNLTSDLRENNCPSWSPDGKWIAYMAEDDEYGGSDIVIIRPNGTNKTNITKTGDRSEQDPSWFAD